MNKKYKLLGINGYFITGVTFSEIDPFTLRGDSINRTLFIVSRKSNLVKFREGISSFLLVEVDENE